MSIAKKKSAGRLLKKSDSSNVTVIVKKISAKDTLFPDKVAEAKKILRNTKFHDPGFFV